MNYYEKRINFLRTEVMDVIFKLAAQEDELCELMACGHSEAAVNAAEEALASELAKVAEMVTNEYTVVKIRFECVNRALMHIGSEIEMYKGLAAKLNDIMDITLETSEYRKVQTFTIRNCNSKMEYIEKLKAYGMLTDAETFERESAGLWICKGLDRSSIKVGIDGTVSGDVVYVYDI